MPDPLMTILAALVRPMASHYAYPSGTPVVDLTNDPSALREDGSIKGSGFLGSLMRPDNSAVMSEYSIADSERLKDPQGNYMDYPSLVPTLTKDEVMAILTNPEGHPLPSSIYQKAEAFALQRRRQGKPMFAQPGEENQSLYPELRRAISIAPSPERAKELAKKRK